MHISRKHYSDSLYSKIIGHFLVVGIFTDSVGLVPTESDLFSGGHLLTMVLDLALANLGILIYFNSFLNIPYLIIQIPLLSRCVYVPIKFFLFIVNDDGVIAGN